MSEELTERNETVFGRQVNMTDKILAPCSPVIYSKNIYLILQQGRGDHL